MVYRVPPPTTAAERADPWLGLEIVAELASSRALAASYLHSFFMTEHFLIFTEQPWIFGSLPNVLYKHVWQGMKCCQRNYVKFSQHFEKPLLMAQ